jgi:putative endonuclease
VPTYYVYILASKPNGTLYIGVTRDLLRRVAQHRKGEVPGFSKKYGLKRLVYYESTSYLMAAVEREKQMKKWKRAWKIELIEKDNPDWHDLFEELVEGS